MARRSGERTIPAQIVREADGFTQAQALTFDAEANIRDGQGEVTDYATYFKGTEISEAEARARGLLSRAKGKAGWSLAKAATDDVYALWRAGRISDAQAVAIANTAPGDAGAQQIGSKFALQGKSPEFIANVIKASRAEAGQRAVTLDLFGADDSAMQTMAEQAERAAGFQRDIAEQIRAVSGAAKRPEVARKLGVDVQDPEGVVKRIAELKAELVRWENWPMQPDLVAKVKGNPSFTLAPAESVAEMEARLKAEAAAKAAADAEQAKKDKLAELQARRLTGNTGDLGQGDLLADPNDLFAPPKPKALDAAGSVGSKRFPATLAKRLLALPFEQQTTPFGDRNATLRQDVMEAITGTRPAKAKAGTNAVRDGLARFFGIDPAKLAGVQIEEAVRGKLEEAASEDVGDLLREGEGDGRLEERRRDTHAKQQGQIEFEFLAQQVIAKAEVAAAGGEGRARDFEHVGVTLGLEGRLRSDLRHTRILTREISEDLIQYGGVDPVGKEVHSAADVALLGQFFRHPQFEVAHWLFVRKGKVVGRYAVSARSKDTAFVLMPGHTYDNIEQMMRDLQADGFYLLHNHPSGDPTPSETDRRMTRNVAMAMRGFLGHVVINHQQYYVIDHWGEASNHYLPNTTLNRAASRKQFPISLTCRLHRLRNPGSPRRSHPVWLGSFGTRCLRN